MKRDRIKEETEHFSKLCEEHGTVWWGHTKPAGKKRLERRAAILREEFENVSEGYLLEVGAGDGVLTQYLAGWSQRVLATDLTPVLVEKAKNEITASNITFEIANVEKLPYEDSYFDGIFGNSILHHLDLTICLKELLRVLKPDCKMVFFEPNLVNPEIYLEKKVRFIGKWLQNSPDETAFVRWKLRGLLRDEGFSNVNVIPFDFLHPAIPKSVLPVAIGFTRALERIPLVKEISGSLIVKAEKPDNK